LRANRLHVSINEVVARDGFQSERLFVPTDAKVALIDALSSCGLARIEATSFTSPKAIPALSDADEVIRRIARKAGVRYTALVPNIRGAERALACPPDEFNLVLSASESHNRSNLRMTRAESVAALAEVVGLASRHGVAVNVSLSCAFGCPIEGDVPEEGVLEQLRPFVTGGVAGVTLCDTTGMAYPQQVRRMCRSFQAEFRDVSLTLHFHNTRGMGLANACAAIGEGVTSFDSSLGGLGGCPYAPGATGNICTEDLVHMLELEGFDTGCDLEALIECSRHLQRLIGRDTPGQVVKAGPRRASTIKC
jgi:hydroxymethylglutaryl-CoA lyase